jgi:hypothetical protein
LYNTSDVVEFLFADSIFDGILVNGGRDGGVQWSFCSFVCLMGLW